LGKPNTRMRWVGHIPCNGTIRMPTNFFLIDVKRRDISEGLGVNERVVLK
jgi:hypothetical protein